MNNKKSTNLTSLILHIIVIWIAFSFKSAHIIVPARSDGMEVSLVTPEELQPQTAPSQIVTKITPVDTNQVRDINFKAENKSVAATPVVKPKPTLKPSPPKILNKPQKAKTIHAIKKPFPANNDVNDLLNDLAPSRATGKSKNSAVGGTKLGTSDSNNVEANYADSVIAAVRPYIEMPPNLDATNVATVEVILLPNLVPYKVTLVKSSGNETYDNNVIAAINRVGKFPDLPSGAKFSDYRKLRLIFKPE